MHHCHRYIAFAVLALCFGACAGAPHGTGNQASQDMDAACKASSLPNDPDVAPPRLVHGGHVKLPPRGLLSGFVCVRVTINESGSVIDPEVVKTDNEDFAKAFVRALPEWQYEPATRGTAPVSYHMVMFAHAHPGF